MKTEILIVGGGVIGLAIAVELGLRQAKVTVLDRDFQMAATHAAAGMLAPGAENIPPGDMLSLCRRSLSLYPGWTAKLEEFTGINSDYWCCGILSPVYDSQASNSPTSNSTSNNGKSPQQGALSYWLDRATIHQTQPGLGKEVIGGYWYPEDGQVNNRSLARALLATAKQVGVEIKSGVTVEGIQQQQGKVIGLQTSIGFVSAEHYVLTAGAWSNQLLPIPVNPKKGQMLSLKVPDNFQELPLSRILFGSGVYIVPRKERKIIVGATTEDVSFTSGNTPSGISSLIEKAIKLFPLIKDYPIDEMWWGFRPTTPDELPILGESTWENLTLATGHHRNGILLAPITASLIADLVWDKKSDVLLESFNYSRFLQSASSSNNMLTQSDRFSNQASNNLPIQVSPPSSQVSEDISLDTKLKIAGKTFTSRLMTGTGKYRTMEDMQQSIAASACEIVTVAVRRVQTKAPGHEGLAEALDWNKIWMLPNTAGCKTAEEAIRVARLGREMAKLLGQEDNNFVKLEVIPDAKYLLPDPIGTLEAAEQLVKEGFAVLPYINADPMLAQRLQEVGCATVMPLAAPIGSGQGLQTTANIQIIIENATVPVVVDAGIGSPSEAAQAMEMGADALLINSAIALAQNSPAMAKAMSMAAVAGRLAFLAGRMPKRTHAIASSPLTGTIS